jgi:chorismate--pyruvate lyase
MRRALGIHAFEPTWLPATRLRAGALPAGLAGWLLDSSSLTRRLQQACAGRFAVEVTAHYRGRPMSSEAAALGMRGGRHALIREVTLSCDGRPWVFARTVIPLATLRGPRRRLAHLGNRPLGALLFREPGMVREPVEVARLDGSAPPAGAIVSAAIGPGIWGRRSIFRLAGHPLLVSEFFLPSFSGGRRCSSS